MLLIFRWCKKKFRSKIIGSQYTQTNLAEFELREQKRKGFIHHTSYMAY